MISISAMSMKNANGNKNDDWIDRCIKSQEDILDFLGYEMIEDLNAVTVYPRRVENFSDVEEKKWMKLRFR